MKVLITGGNGQLGLCLQNELNEQGIVFYAPAKQELDVLSFDSIVTVFDKFQPTIVINAAAYTAVDKAESDPQAAFSVNADAVAALSQLCAERGVTLYHVSTDYVFDGNQASRYDELAPTHPLSVYGQSKLAGEQGFLASGVKGLIVRTSWLYSEFGNNFFKTMLRLAEQRSELGIVTDQIGVPTYARDLARFIVQISLQNITSAQPVVHYCNDGVASWYDFAFAIMQLHKPQMFIKPIATAEYPTPAIRPILSVLNNTKATKVFGYGNRHWRLALQECFDRFSQLNSAQNNAG